MVARKRRPNPHEAKEGHKSVVGPHAIDRLPPPVACALPANSLKLPGGSGLLASHSRARRRAKRRTLLPSPPGQLRSRLLGGLRLATCELTL